MLSTIKLIILCQLVSLFLLTTPLLAQSNQRKIIGNKIEVKAEKSDYIIHEQRNTYLLYNKHNTLMICESSYESKTEMLNYDSVVKFYERSKIDLLVLKIIGPFYQNYESKFDTEEFDITLYSKPDGRVCEMTFSFEQSAKIPIKAIEQLENEILSLGLKLEFDPNSYFVKDAVWVYFPVNNNVSKMKEKLQSGSK